MLQFKEALWSTPCWNIRWNPDLGTQHGKISLNYKGTGSLVVKAPHCDTGVLGSISSQFIYFITTQGEYPGRGISLTLLYCHVITGYKYPGKGIYISHHWLESSSIVITWHGFWHRGSICCAIYVDVRCSGWCRLGGAKRGGSQSSGACCDKWHEVVKIVLGSAPMWAVVFDWCEWH